MTEDDSGPDTAADGRQNPTADGEPGTDTGAEAPGDTAAEASLDTDRPGEMRARTWTIAARFREPADYGIPSLPAWTVYREGGGGLAFGPADGEEVFIAAENPMRVRR